MVSALNDDDKDYDFASGYEQSQASWHHGRMFCKLLLSFVLQTRICDSVMKENYGSAKCICTICPSCIGLFEQSFNLMFLMIGQFSIILRRVNLSLPFSFGVIVKRTPDDKQSSKVHTDTSSAGLVSSPLLKHQTQAVKSNAFKFIRMHAFSCWRREASGRIRR